MNRFTIFAVAVAATVPFFATAADAKTAGTIGKEITVRYSQAEASTQPGLRRLLLRINEAGATVCSSSADTRDLVAMQAARRCRQQAVRQAVANSGMPELIAMHDGRTRPVQIARAERR